MKEQELKILLVEDDEDDVILIKSFIHSEMNGRKVSMDLASSFLEAMACLDKTRYDICLFDYRLGHVNGLDLLRSVRARGITTPVIFLTGQGDEEVAVEAMKAGATDYLIKSKLSSDLLYKSIRYVMELQKKEEALREGEELNSLILNSLTSLIAVLDKEGNIIAVNKTWEHFAFKNGNNFPSCAGVGINYLKVCRQAAEAGIEGARKALVGTQAVLNGSQTQFTLEYSFHSSGKELWFLMRVTRLAGKHGGVVVTHTDITERKQAEETIRYLAYHDALTNLPNRTLFNDRIALAMAQAHRNQHKLAVMFLDLDRFKIINDTLGHSIGDKLLQDVARRLTACLREGDTVARLGGDEFLVLLPKVDQVEDVAKMAERILEIFKTPFRLDNHELFISSSIGITLYPGDGDNVQTLLKNADTALNRAKAQGRNIYQFYTSTMNARAFERVILESGLRRALEQEEFIVYYQPQISLHTGQIVGMEVLLRWQHPDLGLIPPMKFIPLAEDTGLIVQLGEWVLRTACAQNKAWQQAGFPPLCVSVNLSSRLFKQQNLIQLIDRILKETQLDPHYLDLELTEGTAMENAEVAIITLRELKKMGVRLSMDDFGTGYSSLSYLKRFPIDRLKIDRSFVLNITVNPDDAVIAMLIINMAHNLNLKVIAEGVETEEQLSFLRLHHCDEIQGFIFSQPVPAEVFTRFLEEKRCLLPENPDKTEK
ncbi:MAG TPA: EAL domain-containing protein [Candidatus Limnocylindrales bacterium]|nr:EAL domain-containing protein [Candidatus Limnocylindrales bacterium]